MLCSYPRGYEETLVGRDGAIFHSGAASLLILLFHATLSKKVTVNRFPRFSQWAIACFLFPLIFQCQGIKCVTRHPVQSNACVLHALLTWRGKSHDASAKKKPSATAETQTVKVVWTGLCSQSGRTCDGCSGSGGGGTVSHAGKRRRPRVLLM